MGNQVYSRNEYIIIKVARGGYVIINKKKGFKNGHTHLKNFNTAKFLINCCITERLPNDLTPYLLQSIVRISDSISFSEKAEALRQIKIARQKQQRNKR